MKKFMLSGIAATLTFLVVSGFLFGWSWLSQGGLLGRPNGLYVIGTPGYYELVNGRGQAVEPAVKFQAFGEDCGWPLPVRILGKWGYLKSDGSILIAEKYQDATCFSQDYATVTLDGRRRYIAMDGSVLPMLGLLNVMPAYGVLAYGLVPIRSCNGDNCTFGYVDQSGRAVIPPIFDIARPFSDGLALVTTRNSPGLGFINTRGDPVIPLVYGSADTFSEGLASFSLSRNGPFGYLSTDGAVKIAPKFAKARQFYEGMAAVTDGRKWGYIDKRGEIVIAMNFDEAGRFRDGLAKTVVNNEVLHINKKGVTAFRERDVPSASRDANSR